MLSVFSARIRLTETGKECEVDLLLLPLVLLHCRAVTKAAEAQRIDGWILTMKRSGENDDGGGMHQNDEGASKRIKPGQRDDDEDKPEGCSEVLHLNVGGDLTAVLRRTLTSVEGSMLASRFSGRWDDSLERDRDGNFFIDQVRENPSDLKG